MKRLLITGNSHVAAVRLGWRSVKKRASENLEVSFFAAPGLLFPQLHINEEHVFGPVEDGSSTADVSEKLKALNGASSIPLENFDEILAVGVTWAGIDGLVELLSNFSIDGLYEVPRRRFLSLDGFDEFSRALATKSLPPKPWSALSRPRASFVIRPMPSAEVRLANRSALSPKRSLGGAWAAKAIEAALIRPVLERHLVNAKACFARAGLTLLSQPASTLTPEGFTRPELCRERLGPVGAQAPTFDPAHMNADFGRVCVEEFLSEDLRATSPEQAT